MSMRPEQTHWERLNAVATLGVSRFSEALPDLTPEAGIELPPGSPEQTVLRAAAAAVLWRRAGTRSAPGAPVALPALAASAERVVPEAAARRLARMFSEEPTAFIDEWLVRAQSAGRVLPPHWVPGVFEALKPEVRSRYVAVFGDRLRWLAAVDARWRIDETPADLNLQHWATGTLSQRTALLQVLRATDPARGREWLATTWSTDAPEAREAFVALLSVGLSAADESFLENALDDKRKAVRVAAAASLARLSTSDYVRRARERLVPLFVLSSARGGLLKHFTGRKLSVELPAALDAAALRDGIEPKPPPARKLGERTFWLVQLLAIVPPQTWCERFECTPAELLDAAQGTDFAEELLSALTFAALRHPEPAFLLALCALWRGRCEVQQQRATGLGLLSQLLQALPESSRDDELLDLLTRWRTGDNVDVAMDLLAMLDGPWTTTTTEAAFEVLAVLVRHAATKVPYGRPTLDAWARRCDAVQAAPLAAALLARVPEDALWHAPLTRFQELIEFRMDMIKELLE